MLVRVLGSLEVEDEGRPVGLGGPTQRRLLTAMVIASSSVVSADRLAELLGLSEGALRTAISRLRKALGDARVVTAAPGYALRGLEVDAEQFEALVADARGAPPDQAVEQFDRALALWRGEAYAEFADEVWARPDAVRLGELQAAAREDRAETLLGVGRYADAAASLERHLADHPLRDRPRAIVMRALVAQGRQAEALRVFQDHRRYLGEELGTEPSADLVDLERRIATGWREPAPATTARVSMPGAGLGAAANETRQAGELGEPERASRPSNLPTVLTSFVGRVDDVAQVAALLSQHRIVTLVGPGGVGKTRLALKAAGGLVERFPQGVWLVELAPVGEPAGVAHAVASTLSVPQSGGELVGDIIGHLRSQRSLLVIDNCEHVVDAVAELVSAVVAACAGVTVLATSREALPVLGERVWPVRPLRVDDDAVTLFCDRAAAVAPDFELSDHRSAVEEICLRLDGLPLAIELAAARVRSLAPIDIARFLDDRFRLLSAARRPGLPHHRTLRATVEWSHDLLEPAARQLFAELAVFHGWFDLTAVQGVCVDGGDDPLAVVDVLDRLIEQSMVVAEDRHSGRNYRMLETLRQFATERLVALGDATRCERHARYFCDWIERLAVELRGPHEVDALVELDDRRDDLRAAFRWALDHEDVDTALRISAALVRESSRLDFEPSDWASRSIELTGADRHPLVVDAIATAAQRPHARRDQAQHAALVARADDISRARGWEPSAALLAAHHDQAWLVGDMVSMASWIEAELERARRHGDRVDEARQLAAKSSLHGFLDEAGVAREIAEEARALARATGNPTVQLVTEFNCVMMLPDYHEQLAPLRALFARAAELRISELRSLAPFVSGLEARAGDPALAAAEVSLILERLLDGDVWSMWDFSAPDYFFVLVRNELYEAAATVHGHVQHSLALNPARTHDVEVELATVAEHLPAERREHLAALGTGLSPREMAMLILAALGEG